MEEAPKVRLVRCPKCENLLPELPDFSVYQCGGCGAVLRAKRRGLLEDRVLETHDEEYEECGRRVSEKNDVNVGLTSDSGAEMESNRVESVRTFKRNNNENVASNGNSSPGVESRGVVEDFDGSRRGKQRLDLDVDQDRKIRFTEDGHRLLSNGLNDNSVRANIKYDLKSIKPEYVRLNTDNELEEVRPSVGSLRSRETGDQRGVDRNSLNAPHVNPTSIAGHGRFANIPDPDVGSSNYVRGSHYSYVEPIRYGDVSDGLARVKSLENDRAELLRKLEELTDKLTRSCDIAENPRERIHHDHRIPSPHPDTYDRHDSFKPGATRFSFGVNNQPLVPDKHVSRAPYVTHNHGCAPYMDRHGIPFQESYPRRNFAYEYGGCPDVYLSQMVSRPSYQPPISYHQESRYEHLPPHHVDFNQDLFMSHPHETFFHQPACSCLHCINMNRQVASKLQPSKISSRYAHYEYLNRNMYQHVNPLTYDHQVYISEGSNLVPPKSHDTKAITRSSSDMERETAGIGHSRLKNVVAANGGRVGRRLFHPIAGGAPFVTCCNCFELLKLPRNLMLAQKSQRKLKCETCSSILLFELDGKGITVSLPEKSDTNFLKVATLESDMQDDSFQSPKSHQDPGDVSNDDAYENYDDNFQLGDPDFGRSMMRQDPNISTPSSSEDEQGLDSVIVRKETCAAGVSKDEKRLPLPDSPSKVYPNHSFDELMHICGQGNRSKRIDQDTNYQDGKIFRLNPLNDTVMATETTVTATETDVSYNDHLGVSHDSVEMGKDQDLPRINKAGESFFAGLLKKSFGDFSRSSKSTESGKLNVSVNGCSIPDRVVKKAEKLSGPIQSGDYWYDFRSGFWGVMGHPCFGIILPNIEEFNYPMPANCAGGNTEIFVNGRELHLKDLDLLASRGLPTTRHKSYLIEISGRVVDEETGEELDGLGKLAPTVERAKHGFGMRVPKSLLLHKR